MTTSPRLLRRPRTRTGIVTAVLIALAVLAALVILGAGDFPLSVPEVVHAMLDRSAGFERTVVLEWRLPRVLTALCVGACLALSGAIFQSLTDNPLGSPDIIGFSTGAYTGALIVITVLGLGLGGATLGALLGGLATAVVVYVLSFRGGVMGFRLIIVGVGVTAMLSAFNTWLLLRAKVEVALGAALWGAGSLSLADRTDALIALGTLVLLGAVTTLLLPALRQIELGDDTARAHGLRLEPYRLGLIVVGVGLIAIPTAIAGPISFVALAAPQIAARLTRSAGIPMAATAALGALVLVVADGLAEIWLPGGVPVGSVTVVGGGTYLIWLLVRESRRRQS